eukprot:Gb_18505 [translate_table: standard]
MGDWQEIAQSVCIALIFAFMVAKLISIVLSFRDDNLRVTRPCTTESVTETHEIEQTPSEFQNIGEKPTSEIVQSHEHDDQQSVYEEISEKTLKNEDLSKEESEAEILHEDTHHGESHLGDEDDWEGVESTELDETFASATSYVASMSAQSSQKISNDVQLQFYGLYKIATEGPCGVPSPSALKITARAKWNAWQRLGTMSSEAAMQQYITLLTEIRPSWADGFVKSKKKEERSQQQSANTGGIGPVFSTFVHPEGSDDETKLEIIHSCAREADIAGLLQVLEQGIPTDLRDSQGRTALHWAVDRGHLKVVQLLISKGADVNAKDEEGQTPLHYAAVCEREDIAKCIIEHGADASVKDNDGDTPYDFLPKDWKWLSDNV